MYTRLVVHSLALVALASCASLRKEEAPLKTAYIHQYGVEVADAADFNERGSTGEIVKTQKDGVTVRESYVAGQLHGKSSWTFPHSETVAKECIYKDGKVADEKEYFLTGAPKQKTVYSEEGKILVTSWYEEGAPRAIETWENGRLVAAQYFSPTNELESSIKDAFGIRIVRDGLGTLVAQESYVDGHLTLQKAFYSNGVPSAEIPYINGKISGIKKTFCLGGEPNTVEEWVADERHGTLSLYQNGARIAEIPYSHGKKQGVEKRFKEGTDIVVEEISWNDDQRSGPSSVIAGDVKVTDWYLGNRKVTKSEYLERSSFAR
jgi:antitoxin component YwqK of YwqJK toxin-antitoxin module